MTTPLDTTTKSYLDFAGLGSLKAKASKDELGTVREAAQQFESYFMQEIMKSMRATVEKSELLDSSATDSYQDMMDKEMAQKMASNGGIGLADMMVNQYKQRTMSAQDALAQHPGAALPLDPRRAIPLGSDRPEALSLPVDVVNRRLK